MGSSQSPKKTFYLTADCTNVASFLQFFKNKTTDLQQHFKTKHGVDVTFKLQEPPHVTLLGPILVDAGSPLYDDAVMLHLFTMVRNAMKLQHWKMPLRRTKSKTTASPGYKFMDPPNCYWYVANLYFKGEAEKRQYAFVLNALAESLKAIWGNNVQIVETSTHIEYRSSTTTLLSLPLYQKADRFSPHISLYNILWNNNALNTTRENCIDEIYSTIGIIPNGLPEDYTITENDLNLTVKIPGGFAPVNPKPPRSHTPNAQTSTTRKRKNDAPLTQTKWKCPKCGWINNAQNMICGGPMWQTQADGRPKPCGTPRPDDDSVQ